MNDNLETLFVETAKLQKNFKSHMQKMLIIVFYPWY